jgi:HEAT repeat protein
MRGVFGFAIGAILLLHPSSFILHPSKAAEPVVDSIMYRDPDIPAARMVKSFPDLLPLWLEALARPEKDLKCRAAAAIAEAHRKGMKGLEAATEPLVRELERPGVDRTVRAAVVSTLVELDAKDAAPALFKAASDGDPDIRDGVEPALARWDYKPARAEWLARLDGPASRPMLLAIRALGTVKEEKAAPRIRELTLSPTTPAAIRLEAARALGMIKPTGLEDDARRLTADSSARGKFDRLLAASLLHQHKGDDAVRQLQTLGGDSEPTVAAVALIRLIEIDPKLVVPLLEPSIASPDANVRRLAVQVLHRQPSDAHIRLLGDRLNDVHPDVRNQSRLALRDLDAKPELRDFARREAVRILASEDWRGQEQAALLIGQLDHKPATARLIELLNGDRGEAVVAAAWALRKLAVPETLPAVFNYVQGQYQRMVRAGLTGGRRGLTEEAVDLQLSQLVQFFGQAKYKPADAMLRKWIPPAQPANVGFEARAAAAWTLGLIHEGTPVPEVATPLAKRIASVFPPDVEDNRVRQMAAVALGRMKAQSTLPTLREYYPSKKPSIDPTNNACGWAIEQITGEKMPPAGTVEAMQLGWFLQPLPGDR